MGVVVPGILSVWRPSKLLNIIQPDRAYFGQKDGQQVAIITQLVAQLNLPVVVVSVPTLREADGLALSSRNVYLTPSERRIAPNLYRGLQQVETAIHQGERQVNVLCDLFRHSLAIGLAIGNDSHTQFGIDYVAIVTADTLTPVSDHLTAGARIMVAVAAKLGKARLIDNILVDVD